MTTDEKKTSQVATKKGATTYPGQNDGKIPAFKNAGMRTGASRPGPKKK